MSKIVDLYSDTEFKLQFGGKDFPECLRFVKGLKGRLYNGAGKFWTVPISSDLINILKNSKWQFINNAYEIAYGPSAPIVIEKKIIPKVSIDIKMLNKTLRPYQIEAVQQICGLHGRAVLSFPPGCGKTAVAASYFRIHLEDTPTLIVCPAFLKIHWQRELQFWGGLSSHICSGRKSKRPPYKFPAWIINYNILHYWQDLLILQGFKTIIIDECQMISNTEAAWTQSFLQIAKNIKNVIAISGTPIKNRPREFWTVLHLLDKKTFNNRYYFLNHFCGPAMGYMGLTYDGATNVEELHALISGYMIRKEKYELLPDLPPKQRYIIPMELSQPEAYKQAEDEIELLLKQNKKKEAKTALMELSNTAFPLKKEAVMAWIDAWLEKNPEESLVIAAFHHAVLDFIAEKYPDSILIDGRHPAEKRQEQVDAFQRGEKRILIGQIQAAGIGFTMTKASTMVVAEVCYVPGDLEQLEDRLARLTQLADRVEIYYLVGEGTIEDAMMDSVAKKANNLSKILDGKSLAFWEK